MGSATSSRSSQPCARSRSPVLTARARRTQPHSTSQSAPPRVSPILFLRASLRIRSGPIITKCGPALSLLGIIKGIDQHLTGKVDRIDKELIGKLIDESVVPLVSPLAFGPDGKSLRVNSDLLAAEMAEVLHATKIIYLAPGPGLEMEGDVRREISVDLLRKILSEEPEKIAESAASKAAMTDQSLIDSGTPRGPLSTRSRAPSAPLLNEIFSNEGVGSLVYGASTSQYQEDAVQARREVGSTTPDPWRPWKREELAPPPPSRRSKEHPTTSSSATKSTRTSSRASTVYFYPDKPHHWPKLWLPLCHSVLP